MEIADIIKGECIDLNHEGLGVVKVDGFPIFVENLLIGEIAKIKIAKINKNYALGEVETRLKDSDDRVMPICSHFARCGGCDLMHMNYESQLSFKKKMINETLRRIGHLDFRIDEIIGAKNPHEYRNKVQIPYRFNGRKIVCGFYQKKSHRLIEFNNCHIQSQLTTDIAKFIRNLLNEYKIPCYDDESGKGIFRHLLVRKTSKNDYMVVLICKTDKIISLDEIVSKIHNRYQEVKSIILNINELDHNVILGQKHRLLYGNDFLVDEILGLKFKMSHKAFFQINHEQTEILYKKVQEYADLREDDVVLDCYCGVGTISLMLAQKAQKVYGIEIVPDAVEDAIANLELNKDKLSSSEVVFIAGSVENEIKRINENVDVLVCDPPRKGLENSIITSIIEKNIEKIVYVSCDCATLARDLKILSAHYEIKKGICVDLFPQTSSVETVVLLCKK